MKMEVAVSSETLVPVYAVKMASHPANSNAMGSVCHENKIFR
jgi:hypothetical protein